MTDLTDRLRSRAKDFAITGNHSDAALLQEAVHELERLDKAAYFRIPLPRRKPRATIRTS